MRFDNLTKPISPDSPCGEDLMDTGDPDFLGYYFDAEAKFPDRYVSITTGEAFDKTTIDLKAEQKTIASLLEKSRDLRLLALDARFSALAGRIKPFCEAVIGMANLLEAFPDDVHPLAGDNPFERQSAIEALDTRATSVTPLDYASIVNDRRAGEITHRGYLIGSGQAEGREGETAIDASAAMSAMGSPDNAGDVDSIHKILTDTADALTRISAACSAYPPSLDNIKGKIPQLLAFIEQSRSDLSTGDASSGDAATSESGDAAPAAAVASGPPAVAGSIQSHGDAKAALDAVMSYFRTREPSSPALILVRQAFILVGRPLVEALEVLLPNGAHDAMIDLGGDTGFKISMQRMVDLSQATMDDGPMPTDEMSEPRLVENRDQALAEIKAVEAFFQTMEPASPIPVLMFKARSFLNSDFQSIVRDLIPPQSGKR